MSRNLDVHFSSNSTEWETPEFLFEALDAEFGFNLDAAATAANAKCEKYYTKIEDSLKQPWEGVVFLNPPYGREIGKFVARAFEASQAGATVVCLLPARTDTRWWHRYVIRGEIRFLRGRIKFGGAKHGAPFPSAVVVFRPPRAGIQFQ